MKIEQTDFDKWVDLLELTMSLVDADKNRKTLRGSFWIICAIVAHKAMGSGADLETNHIYEALGLQKVANKYEELLDRAQIESRLKEHLSFKGYKVVTTVERPIFDDNDDWEDAYNKDNWHGQD